MGAVFVVLGAVSIQLSVAGILSRGERWTGVLYLAVGAIWFIEALRTRRRQQRSRGQAPPPVAPEVVTLARQGQKVKAIRLYRELNPGTGLKEAKDAVDSL